MHPCHCWGYSSTTKILLEDCFGDLSTRVYTLILLKVHNCQQVWNINMCFQNCFLSNLRCHFGLITARLLSGRASCRIQVIIFPLKHKLCLQASFDLRLYHSATQHKLNFLIKMLAVDPTILPLLLHQYRYRRRSVGSRVLLFDKGWRKSVIWIIYNTSRSQI